MLHEIRAVGVAHLHKRLATEVPEEKDLDLVKKLQQVKEMNQSSENDLRVLNFSIA